MTRIYLAASSRELERAKHWAERLEREGFELTAKWWEDVEAEVDANPTDHDARIKYARKDVFAVARADFLWLLVPPHGVHSHGAFLEYGLALGGEARRVASGDTKRSIFLALGEEFETDEEAFWFLMSARNYPVGAKP